MKTQHSEIFMKSLRCCLLAFAMLLIHGTSHADPVVHKFSIWGKLQEVDKIPLYIGWGDGFFLERTPRFLETANCLQTIDVAQAIAMIDKFYKAHPELWGHPLGEEILNSVTVAGGPCEGRNPLVPTP